MRCMLMEIGGKTYHYEQTYKVLEDAGIPKNKAKDLFDNGTFYMNKEGRKFCLDIELDENGYDYDKESRLERRK